MNPLLLKPLPFPESGRVVPILMTALAARLALLPIALSAGQPRSEIQAPMATMILCGLFSSTALNMMVVPVLFERFGCRERSQQQPARLLA